MSVCHILKLESFHPFNTSDGLAGTHNAGLESHSCKNGKLSINPELAQDPLLQLDPYNLMGPEGIHPRVFKELADVTARPLSTIFQHSWESGEVPVDWKLASISFFKNGNRDGFSNYRSGSLTSVPGKITEKIILEVIK